MKNKKTFIMAVIIAVLVVVIGIMGFFLISGKKNSVPEESSRETTEKGESTTDVSSGEQSGYEKHKDAAEKEKTEEKEPLQSGSPEFYVQIGHDSTWEADGRDCATENINIYNRSKNNVSDWKLVITYKASPVIEQIWNAKKDIKNNDVVLTPEDYNREIPAGGSINLGYNISSEDLTVSDYVLYIDGREYKESNAAVSDADADESEKKEVKEPESGGNESPDSEGKDDADGKTPFDIHGRLSLSGTDIVDEHGEKFQLKGVSTHGITWFPDYVNEDAFKTVRDDWGANLIRIAMYTDTGDANGYCSGGDKEGISALVDLGVTAATDLGMYVIVDWHILNDNDPNTHIEDSVEFFNTVSKKYAGYGNVLYEICNEPNGGTSWESVKTYAQEIIPVIRENDKDAIIIVGTPNWSQDVDIASQNMINGYDNIMYAVHFYAATHKDDLRNKVLTAIDNGLPVFVSEFSLCDASGNGGIDYDSSDAWFNLIDENNLSYAAWSLCNKNETSALLDPSVTSQSGFTENDLSDTGKYIRDKMRGK